VDLPVFRALLSDTGQEAIQTAMDLEAREVDFLAHFTGLSRQYPRELARAALGIAILRREAAGKFPFADRMYLTREGLEQSTAYEVSAYRAERYRSFSSAIDLGCSVGGDTLALAAVLPTTGVDNERLRLEMARANLAAVALSERASFIQADLTSGLPFAPQPGQALFFDPARRVGGRRIYSVDEYQPPLNIIRSWLKLFPALGVKISPGVRLDEVNTYDAELEFISLHGELKEAVLWFGPLKTSRRRATLLPGGHSLSFEEEPDLPVHDPGAYLYEPDPGGVKGGYGPQSGADFGSRPAGSRDRLPDGRYQKAHTFCEGMGSRRLVSIRDEAIAGLPARAGRRPYHCEKTRLTPRTG
jgi:hypothetical protein